MLEKTLFEFEFELNFLCGQITNWQLVILPVCFLNGKMNNWQLVIWPIYFGGGPNDQLPFGRLTRWSYDLHPIFWPFYALDVLCGIKLATRVDSSVSWIIIPTLLIPSKSEIFNDFEILTNVMKFETMRPFLEKFGLGTNRTTLSNIFSRKTWG